MNEEKLNYRLATVRAERDRLRELLRDALRLCWGPGFDAQANYALMQRIKAELEEDK